MRPSVALQKMKSDTEMEMVFKSQLISLQTKSRLIKKKQEKKGIEKYLAGDSDSDEASGESD